AIYTPVQAPPPAEQRRCRAERRRRQLEDLRKGPADLALRVGPVYASRGLDLVARHPQHCVIAVPLGHPLAARRKVRMKELAAESFVSFPAVEGTGFASALLGACQAAGFIPRVVKEASRKQAILH